MEETSFEWLIIQCSRLSHGENGSFSLSPSKWCPHYLCWYKNGDLSMYGKEKPLAFKSISNFTFYLSPTIATGDCFLPSPSSVTFSGAPFRSMAAWITVTALPFMGGLPNVPGAESSLEEFFSSFGHRVELRSSLKPSQVSGFRSTPFNAGRKVGCPCTMIKSSLKEDTRF